LMQDMLGDLPMDTLFTQGSGTTYFNDDGCV